MSKEVEITRKGLDEGYEWKKAKEVKDGFELSKWFVLIPVALYITFVIVVLIIRS